MKESLEDTSICGKAGRYAVRYFKKVTVLLLNNCNKYNNLKGTSIGIGQMLVRYPVMKRQYFMIYKRSSELFAAAKKVIPGGVNSPVRAFSAVGGEPIFIKEAKGAYLFDEDGNKYIDYINSWGPLILGHAFEPVVNAVVEKAKKGTSFGTPTELETEYCRTRCFHGSQY